MIFRGEIFVSTLVNVHIRLFLYLCIIQCIPVLIGYTSVHRSLSKWETSTVSLTIFQGLLVGGRFRDALPLVIMGSPAIVVGILPLWLPETRNCALTETLKDLENTPRYCKVDTGIELFALSNEHQKS